MQVLNKSLVGGCCLNFWRHGWGNVIWRARSWGANNVALVVYRPRLGASSRLHDGKYYVGCDCQIQGYCKSVDWDRQVGLIVSKVLSLFVDG
jgi:hypothetical protein